MFCAHRCVLIVCVCSCYGTSHVPSQFCEATFAKPSLLSELGHDYMLYSNYCNLNKESGNNWWSSLITIIAHCCSQAVTGQTVIREKRKCILCGRLKSKTTKRDLSLRLLTPVETVSSQTKTKSHVSHSFHAHALLCMSAARVQRWCSAPYCVGEQGFGQLVFPLCSHSGQKRGTTELGRAKKQKPDVEWSKLMPLKEAPY